MWCYTCTTWDLGLTLFSFFFPFLSPTTRDVSFFYINYSNVSHIISVLIYLLTAFSTTLALRTLVCVHEAGLPLPLLATNFSSFLSHSAQVAWCRNSQIFLSWVNFQSACVGRVKWDRMFSDMGSVCRSCDLGRWNEKFQLASPPYSSICLGFSHTYYFLPHVSYSFLVYILSGALCLPQ